MASVNDVLIATGALMLVGACKRWPPPRSIPVAEMLAIASATAAAVQGHSLLTLIAVLAFASATCFRLTSDAGQTATGRPANATIVAAVVGLLAAGWLDREAVTLALFAIAFAGRHFALVAAGTFLPLMVLLQTDASNAAAMAALTVLTCTLFLAGRPTQPSGVPIVVAGFASLLLSQFAPRLAESADSRWVLGAGIAPASAMMLLAGGGRGLNAVRVSDVVNSFAAAFAATCFAGTALVAAGQADAWPVYLALIGSVVNLIAVALFTMSSSSEASFASLETLAGKGRRQPVVMTLLSAALLGCLPFLPLTAGWLWLDVLQDSLESTRLDPQPALLLLLIAVAGPLVLVPTIGNVLVTVWQSEPKGVGKQHGVPRLVLGTVCVVAAPAAFLARFLLSADGLPR